MITINRTLDMQGYDIVDCGNWPTSSGGGGISVLRCTNYVQNTINKTTATQTLWHDPSINTIDGAIFDESIVTLPTGTYKFTASVTVVPGVNDVNILFGYLVDNEHISVTSNTYQKSKNKKFTITLSDIFVVENVSTLQFYTQGQGRSGTVISVNNAGVMLVEKLS